MTRIILFLAINILNIYFAFGQEVQIPMDNDNKINVIDKELELTLNMFPEYQGFTEARLFQVNDTSFVLEISFETDGKLNRRRINMTETDLKEFKTKLSEKLIVEAPKVLLNQEGRTRMLVFDILMGLGAYGWMIPFTLEIEDFKVNTAIYMFIGAGSFFVPYLLTEDMPVSKGDATLHIFGSLAGLAHGSLICSLFDTERTESYLLTMTTVSIAEGIAGFIIANKTNMSAGKAQVISTVGSLGFGYGAGISVLADAKTFKTIAASMLAGSYAGMLAGNWLANTQNYTIGDAYVLSNSAFIGFCVPGVLLLLTETADLYIISSSLMAGTTLGLWYGDYLVRGLNFTESQGTYISLGTTAGFLMGLGIGYLVSPDDFFDLTKTIFTGAAIGAGTGFALMYNTFKNKAKVPDGLGKLEFNFSPAGLSNLFIKNNSRPELNYYSPVLSLSYKF